MSESWPSVADTSWVDCCSRATGRAPYLSAVDSALAESSSKLPLIWIWSAENDGTLMLGAEMTRPSSVIASWPVGHSAAFA